MKSSGSKKITIGAWALLLSVFALYAPTSAHAVTTPSQYCATVAGCEILNVVGGGSTVMPGSKYAALIIHYCKSGRYTAIELLVASDVDSDRTLGTFVAPAITAETMCPRLP